MAIVQTQDGGLVVTGEDVELYAVLAIKAKLHLELSVPAFAPQMGRLLRLRGEVTSRNREQVYRQWCAKNGLDPSCSKPGHGHGPQTTFRVKQGGQWVVVRGEGGSERS
jgi:hypothetical protein